MPLPISAKNKKLLAEQVFRMLENLNRYSRKTLATMSQNEIINLYYLVQRIAKELNQLTSEGYTSEVLGPILGAEYEIEWAAYEQEFLDLKNIVLPQFINEVDTKQNEILSRFLGADSVKPVQLSQVTRESVAAKIQAIADTFPSGD